MKTPILRKNGPKHERKWQGIPLFGFGFRPFFLFASLFALLAMCLWLADLNGYGILVLTIKTVNWHQHEMLFGYAPAVIAGFLFTAVPNWTGRYPVAGWPLIAIFSIWAAGRIAMFAGGEIPYLWVAIIDAAFLPVLAAVMGREIFAGRNRKNLRVLVPILFVGIANIWFHYEMMTAANGEIPLRLGFSGVLLLVILIGGRIIPSFTRNYLARQPEGRMPVPFNRFDGLTVGFSAATFAAWVFADSFTTLLAGMFALGAVLHTARLFRWAGWRAATNPLLLVLHIFYGFIPVGFAMFAFAFYLDDPYINTAALHVFGIGAITGMTMSVMVRASLGHTGRPLAASAATNAMLAFLVASVSLRVVGAIMPQLAWIITASALCWIIAFALFAFQVGPWLVKKRA
jgi:uncharacterized protein involved in response to NO